MVGGSLNLYSLVSHKAPVLHLKRLKIGDLARAVAQPPNVVFSLKAFYKLSFREGMCGRRGRQHVPLVRSSSYCFIKKLLKIGDLARADARPTEVNFQIPIDFWNP